MDFSGKTIIVTGSARGNGKRIAQSFIERGGTVVIADIDGEKAERTAEELASSNTGHAMSFRTDVTDPSEVEELMSNTHENHGGLDILVNNAGIYQRDLRTEELPLSEWERVFDIHVKGTFLCTKLAIPLLATKEESAIVNISSIAGMGAFPNRAAYSPAKAAINMLTKVVSVEVATEGLRVNAVAPGFVRKPDAEPTDSELQMIEERENRTPTGELIDQHSVANAIVFLASTMARDITGVVLPVDGGWTAYGYV